MIIYDDYLYMYISCKYGDILRFTSQRYGPIWTWFAGIITPFLRLDNKVRCKNQESEKLGKTQMFQKL